MEIINKKKSFLCAYDGEQSKCMMLNTKKKLDQDFSNELFSYCSIAVVSRLYIDSSEIKQLVEINTGGVSRYYVYTFVFDDESTFTSLISNVHVDRICNENISDIETDIWVSKDAPINKSTQLLIELGDNTGVWYDFGAIEDQTVAEFADLLNKCFYYYSDKMNEKVCNVGFFPTLLFDKPIYKDSDFTKKTLYELFAATSKSYPEKKALSFGDKEYTFKQLNDAVDRCALSLVKEIRSGSFIGIQNKHTDLIIIGILAILKAGCAYVPIDFKWPEERINLIFKECSIEIVLTDGTIECEQFCCRDINHILLEENIHSSSEIIHTSSDISYVIYTSGTTGVPKGVYVKNKGVVNIAEQFQRIFNITPNDRVALFASLTFDASVSEIFMSLLNGAQLCILSENEILNINLFYKALREKEVSIITLPPSYISCLSPKEMLTLRLLIAAGSQSYFDEALRWSEQGIHYVNGYGPTEASICATYCKFDKNYKYGKIPIGKPIENNRCYIVGRSGKTLLPMMVGEIYIAGSGVSTGYLNRPEIQSEKYVPDFILPGEFMYKTGDLGRYLPDGKIEYIRRVDNQVKLRGYRIELEDVIRAMMRVSGVKDAAAKVIKNDVTENLIGFVVFDKGCTGYDLRKQLESILPIYFIPDLIIEVDRLPLNLSGKIDYNILTDLYLTHTHKSQSLYELSERQYVFYEIIMQYSSVVVDLNAVIEMLGLNSLCVLRIIADCYKQLEIELSIDDFLPQKTVYELISRI